MRKAVVHRSAEGRDGRRRRADARGDRGSPDEDELSQAYGELGRKAAELVESGAISHADLAPIVEKIKALKAELAAAGESEPAADEPAQPAS